MKKIVLTCVLVIFFITNLIYGQAYGQVGIGTMTPDKSSALDVTWDKINPLGALIPRMTEAERNAIEDPANGLMIFNIDEGCINVFDVLNDEWSSICGKMGRAIFDIDCTSIQVFGNYSNGEGLTASNYIKVKVDVTKPGSYSMSALANPDNGYFFSASGEFLTTGTFTVVMAGLGTPINFTPDGELGDLVEISGDGAVASCTTNIKIMDSSVRPKYTMNCSRTVVFGEYYEEEQLNTNGKLHYMDIELNVDPTSVGAAWEIETNEVDGIKFKGNGILGSGSPQTVRIWGEGTPYYTMDKMFVIKTNSESSTATCNALVYIIIPVKVMMTLGNSNGYGYNFGGVGTGAGDYSTNKMITDKDNYGPKPTSIVRCSGWTNTGSNPETTTPGYTGSIVRFDDPPVLTVFTNYLKGINGFPKVDIVTIGYSDVLDDARATALVDFVKAGGILLMFCEDAATNRLVLRKLFNKPDIDITAGAAAGSIYRYANSQADPVLNGPFGNLAGLTWGEDASTTYFATNLPLEEVTLYSANKPETDTGRALVENSATAFRHNTLPVIWCGDGGFNSGNNSTGGSTICPFKLTSKTIGTTTYPNFPTYRANFGPTGATQIWNAYNAMFTANALAWCLKKAEENKRKN